MSVVDMLRVHVAQLELALQSAQQERNEARRLLAVFMEYCESSHECSQPAEEEPCGKCLNCERAQALTERDAAIAECRKRDVLSEHSPLRVAVLALSRDMHGTSTRPCATCAAVTAALGEPFGCDAMRVRR